MSYQTSINTLAELKAKAPATHSFSIEQIWPDLFGVERKYIRPAVSKDLFDALMVKYQTPIAFSAKEAALWDLVQATSSALGLWAYTPKLNIQISNSGLHNTSTTTKKVPWEWQVRDLRIGLKKQGMQSLDELVQFLVDNETDPAFALWLASPERDEYYEHYITSVAGFEKFVNIGSSNFLFRKMFAQMNFVEFFRIPNIISPELAAEIKAEVKAATLTPANGTLLAYIKGAVAHLTMAASINDLGLVMDDENIYQMDFNRTETVITPKPADLIQKAKLIDQQNEMANTYLGMISQTLATDPENDYPTYFNSSTYTATMPSTPYKNESGSSIYVL